MTGGVGQGVQRMIEDALRRVLEAGIPGDRIAGQLTPGPLGPLPPGGNTSDGYTPAPHDLISDRHTASGLTTGQVLRATGATAFAFGALDLANSNAVTGILPVANGGTGVATANANTGFFGPTTGSPAAPGMRTLVIADMPADVVRRASSATAGRIAFWSGADTISHDADLVYDTATDQLRMETGYLRLGEIGAPTTPASGYAYVYVDSLGVLSSKDDAGTVRKVLRSDEGSSTPALAGSGTAGTFTYDTTNTRFQYERIGNKMFFNGRINITATSVAPTGNMSITGLPTAAGANSNNGNILGAVVIGYNGINLQAGYTQVHGFIVGGSSSILLYEMGDNVARAIVQGGEIASAVDLFFAGWYKVD